MVNAASRDLKRLPTFSKEHGDIVTATFTEEGTATLPAGRLQFIGRRV